MTINQCWRATWRAGFLLLLPLALAAQVATVPGTGRLIGKILEGEHGASIGGATVFLVGTSIRGTTTVDGRFTLRNVPAGTVSLRALMIGFAPKTVTGVVVKAGGITEQNLVLNAQTVQLQEITVAARAETGTVNAAIDEQRTSVGIVNGISAEQMAKSPDGDASASMQRLSGATVEDGHTLNMRGLGDRYTTASLDGARIPSPEPERRTVPFDLFPSAQIEAITTQKTFTPDQPGDFSGGAVNIKMKDFTGQRNLTFSVSSGLNASVTGKALDFAPTTARDWLAFGSSARAVPSLVSSTNFRQALTGAQTNALINSFRNTWSAHEANGRPNSGFGLSLGGSLPGPKNGIGYLIAGNYSYAQETRTDETRAQAQAASVAGGDVTPVDQYRGSTARASAQWGGIANLGMAFGASSKLSLHNMYNRTMDNEGRYETGLSDKLGYPLQIERLRYVERSIYSSQLSLHQELGTLGLVDATVTYSGVARKEPDRSEIVYETSTGQPAWLGFSNEAAVRTFGNLTEHATQGDLNWQINLGASASPSVLRLGGLYRTTDRNADNRAYSITLLAPLSGSDQYLAPEQLFDGRFTADPDTPRFAISPTSAGGSYSASDRLAAGFAMLTKQVAASVELTGGVRVEHSDIAVASLSATLEPTLTTPHYTDLLPSLAATVRLNNRVNLRLSASQTLSRPEYRELSPITYREVLGQDNIRGNASLKRALIQNYDVRYEFYPTPAEVLSVAAFVKEFSNPVERIYQGTSDQHLVTFVNARGAHNYGVELEGRKRMGFLAPTLNTLTASANLTLMKSRISIDPASGSLTNDNRKMVGQAPYVLNAGLTWSHPTSEASATLLFNRVGERISDAGEIPLPDVVEASRSVVDASVLLPLFNTLRARVDGKNLLDAPYRRTQGAVVRESYRAGRVFSIGFTWSQ